MAAPPPANVPLQNLAAVGPRPVNVNVQAGGQQQGGQQPPHNQQQPNAPPAPALAHQLLRRPSDRTRRVEWLKVANAMTTIMLAAAGLAAAFVFGKLAEKKDSENLRATLWRDCIDLAVRRQCLGRCS